MTCSLVRTVLVASACLAFACGSDGLGPNVDGGIDLAHVVDSSVTDHGTGPTDLAGPSVDLSQPHSDAGFGISCGTSTCGAGSVCCVSADVQSMTATETCVVGTSCGDAGITAACDGPEDCPSSASACCADLSFSQGMMSIGGDAMCTATCDGSATFGGGGGGSIKTKLCHTASDCTGYQGTTPFGSFAFDSCCAYPGASYDFCAPALASTVLMGVTCQ